ncbi:MAG: glycosyltransferase, partial [Planctomycetota bacterium]
MTLRVAVVTPIPTPYRDPFWLRFSAREDVSLRVLFCAAGKADRPWDASWGAALDARVMPGRNLLSWRGPDASCYWNPSCRRELDQFAPEVVLIGGYNHPTMLAAMRWAQRRSVPFVLMCETWRARSGGAKAWLRNALVRRVMRRAAGVLTTGARARRFVAHHAGRATPCADLPNVPDIRAILAAAPARRAAPDRARVLFVGRFIPKKRVQDLLAAFAALPRHLIGRAHLDLVGDGDLRGDLAARVKALGIGAQVTFHGFLQPRDVQAIYRCADVFVMPSSETWGVAPIEAAAAGLRVVVSDAVGCADDLARFVAVGRYRFGDVAALREALAEQLEGALTSGTRPAV